MSNKYFTEPQNNVIFYSFWNKKKVSCETACYQCPSLEDTLFSKRHPQKTGLPGDWYKAPPVGSGGIYETFSNTTLTVSEQEMRDMQIAQSIWGMDHQDGLDFGDNQRFETPVGHITYEYEMDDDDFVE